MLQLAGLVLTSVLLKTEQSNNEAQVAALHTILLIIAILLKQCHRPYAFVFLFHL